MDLHFLRMNSVASYQPNGLRYPLVGGTRSRHFDGTSFKPRKLPENAQSPTSRVHAVLGGAQGVALPIWQTMIDSTLQ